MLHVVGSPTDKFSFEISLMYSRSLIKANYKTNHVNVFAVVHPDGSWSFPSDLEEDFANTKSYRNSRAISMIEDISPHCAVIHVVCEKRSLYIAVLEMLGVPVIGSNSHVSANIVDKGISRAILVQGGVKVADGEVLVRGEEVRYGGRYPAVVKPTKMENSVGVEIVHNEEEMRAAVERGFAYGESVLVDEFIAGREVRCGVVELAAGEVTPLGVMEYRVDTQGIRRFEDKLEGDAGQLKQAASTRTWLLEARLEEELVKRVQDVAVKVHSVMGCTDFSQIDCRYGSKHFLISISLMGSF